MMKKIVSCIVILFLCPFLFAEDLVYKDRALDLLVQKVPDILDKYNSETGRFGEGVWICQDQHSMYPLAVAWATKSPRNKYYKNPALLDVIMKAGDALIQDTDKIGKWEFRKKDGSTWGPIWMPWTYSRWIRAFLLIKDEMPPERRKSWEKALILGYSGIRENELQHVHNIPAHHGMGLYFAGKALDKPQWSRDAGEFLFKVAQTQFDGGYWSENSGPVVSYNYVYIDALGTYYAASGDKKVLPALEKAASFHLNFTYPGGQNIETVDQRNPYHSNVSSGNAGFTFTPVGRLYLKNQWDKYNFEKLHPDFLASLVLFGEEGVIASPEKGESLFILRENGFSKAATFRHGPWFVCLSAYAAPIHPTRWIQDRQNFVSIYHEKTGLILGGGNTKLQPLWSNFTVGDIKFLQHKPGDINPDFYPKGDLFHIPSTATLVLNPPYGLELLYGSETCRVNVFPRDERTLEYILESALKSSLPVSANLTLIPHLKKSLVTGKGEKFDLKNASLELSPEQIGGSITHAGWKIKPPETATLLWPALPHNPYRKDGAAEPDEGRIVIRIPFDAKHTRHSLIFEVIN
ncbi:hypothetical protein JW926_12470 [Candidatus Sumerlaeota bacterium]|nr:hypothetical protein [Candidatus Sumerlaeota bacterium]